MDRPSTRRIIEVFDAAKAEVRFVGGCVRDTLAGRTVGDIDIATATRPDRVIEILDAAGIRTIPTGIEHGTVTAVVDGQPFEITTYRRDVETDGRHAVVSFGTDWREDAERRDFTINTLSVTPDGTLWDPFGGEADLRAGRIRFVGEARRRVREDVLRILRWFRFYAHFGRHHPDRDALEACRGFAYRIPDLSGERIRHEILRLLEAPDPLPSLRLMQETDVIDAVLGRGRTLDLLTALMEVERLTETPGDAILRMAALFTQPKVATVMSDRLRLSNTERRRIAGALSEDSGLDPSLAPAECRRILYRLSLRDADDRIRLAWAANIETAGWNGLLEINQAFDRPTFPLSGRDVDWLPEGPAIGEALTSAETWWVEQEFQPDRAACLAYLQSRRPA